MDQEVDGKQHSRLMSDSSNPDEEGEEAALCGDSVKSDDRGFCKSLLKSKTAKLVSMLILIVGYFLTEVVVGHLTNSLTLVADSFHMLSDALSLIVALVAVRMSRRTAKDPFRPWPSKEPYFNTFGWVRFEILGALINSTFLLALCVSIALEAIEKFTDPEQVDDPQLVLAVGGGGLLINIIGLIMFGSHSHGHSHGHDHSHSDSGKHPHSQQVSPETKVIDSEQHLNMRAVFLHVLGDALGSVIVMISATVILLVPKDNNSWTEYMDPSMSLVLVCIMVFTTVPLFKQSSMILLQTVPKHIKLEAIRNKIQKIAGIQAIHDLHIWQLTGDKIVATVHVQCANAETYLTVVQKIKEALHHEGIHSFTVQPEFSFSEDEQSPFCQLVCGEDCISKTCCPQDNPSSEKNKSPTRVANGGNKVAEQRSTNSNNSGDLQMVMTSLKDESPPLLANPIQPPMSTTPPQNSGDRGSPGSHMSRPLSTENPTVQNHSPRSEARADIPDSVVVVDINPKASE